MKEEFLFCPLGGSGEIGMNMNLFSYGKTDNQKWVIVDIGVTFADDTLEACFNVGTSSDADAYCKLNITDGTAITDTFNIQNDTNAIIAEAIPADTQIECLPVAGTDGSGVTGQGYTYVVVEWY